VGIRPAEVKSRNSRRQLLRTFAEVRGRQDDFVPGLRLSADDAGDGNAAAYSGDLENPCGVEAWVAGDDDHLVLHQGAGQEEDWYRETAQRVALDEADSDITRSTRRERERVRLFGWLRLGRGTACQQREQQTD